MPLPLLVPPKQPTAPATGAINIHAKAIAFGEGYEQREEGGLNSRRRTQSWAWRHLSQSEYDTLVGFLSDNAVSGFRYAFPGDTERRWKVVDKIDWEQRRDNRYTVTVEVKEIFDP